MTKTHARLIYAVLYIQGSVTNIFYSMKLDSSPNIPKLNHLASSWSEDVAYFHGILGLSTPASSTNSTAQLPASHSATGKGEIRRRGHNREGKYRGIERSHIEQANKSI
jgi:hypothetical protein